MGGLAFTTAPYNLKTPRLPPSIYYRLRDDFQDKLRTLYGHAASPIAAPDKESHGDIDIIVAAPKRIDGGVGPQCLEDGKGATAGYSPKDIAAILGAERWIAIKNNPTLSFAIQLTLSAALFVEIWQEQQQQQTERRRCIHEDALPLLSPGIEVLDADVIKHPTALSCPSPVYVQVDVHVLPIIQSSNISLFQWRLFHHSHGDLWNLLGTTIRPFGLTANEQGLHVRIPEIESHNRKRSLIFLTTDCHAILSFLALDTFTSSTSHVAEPAVNREDRRAHVLEDEFASVEDMYQYICRGRFFRKGTYEGWHSNQESQGEAGSMGVAGRSKHNDRKRMAQRAIYRRFVEEWVPALPDDGKNIVQCSPVRSESARVLARHASRHSVSDAKDEEAVENPAITVNEQAWASARRQVLDEALNTFCKRAEYDRRLAEWIEELWHLGSKQCGRKRKKAHAAEDGAYASAWMAWLVRVCDP